MAKRKHNITLRVYDSAKNCKDFAGYQDRYALYFPYPKEWIKGDHVADYFAFSFTHDDEYPRGASVIRCYWDEWHRGRNGYASNLGKKLKIESLPKHVQEWIAGYQKVWNDLINDPDNQEIIKAWEAYH